MNTCRAFLHRLLDAEERWASPSCPGRSYNTLVILNKPIEKGYKLWVLAKLGYSLSWVFHCKGSLSVKDLRRGIFGPYSITQPKDLGKNNFSAVVSYLMDQIPKAGHPKDRYIWYLDNLFINIKLLTHLRIAEYWCFWNMYN